MSRDRSAWVLLAAIAVVYATIIALAVFLPVWPWPWLIVRLVLIYGGYEFSKRAARWYLHAGRLPRWWWS